MGEFEELEALAAGVDASVGGQIRTAVERCRAPATVQVAGRAGVGRRSVAAALGMPADVVAGPVDAMDRPDPVLDADVVVYLVAGSPHPADRWPPERTLLVRNKVDLFDLRDDALPMIATLALATSRHQVTPDDMDRFRVLARSTDVTLLLAEPLFRHADAEVGPDERAALLHRWGFAGIACAVAAVRRDPGLDAGRLHRILRSASGVEAVAEELATRIDAARHAALHDDLAAIVARTGCERVERFTQSRTAADV